MLHSHGSSRDSWNGLLFSRVRSSVLLLPPAAYQKTCLWSGTNIWSKEHKCRCANLKFLQKKKKIGTFLFLKKGVALQRASNNAQWSEWNEKLERGTRKSHKSDRQRAIRTYAGLHGNTSHAYSQDVLPFMLGRKGERIHGRCENQKERKNEMGTAVPKDTPG